MLLGLLLVLPLCGQATDAGNEPKQPKEKTGAKSTPLKDLPPAKVDRKSLPKDAVLVELCEKGLSAEKNAWPDSPPAATEHYFEKAFALFRFPNRYIETGIRADRANPLFARVSAVVSIPAGKHRFHIAFDNTAMRTRSNHL